jgi:hypothetical protein
MAIANTDPKLQALKEVVALKAIVDRVNEIKERNVRDLEKEARRVQEARRARPRPGGDARSETRRARQGREAENQLPALTPGAAPR